MSYELSFSQEFYGYGEEERNKKGNPTNLWTAICDYVGQELPANRKDLLELIGVPQAVKDENGEHISFDVFVDELMKQAEEVNTCLNLNTPVEVCLDEEGYVTVEVY